jgi:hypothetical protein
MEGARVRAPIRSSFVLATVLAALVVGAQPAAAYDLISADGRTGYWEAYDTQAGMRGANCLYEAASFDLDRITIRPPQMHGDYPQLTWVGWRYIVQRNAPPVGDQQFTDHYTSSIVKDRADDEAIGDFARRSWTAPESPTGQYRIRIVMLWYAPGSQSTVEGRVVLQYEWYKAKHGSDTPYVNQGYCLPNW